MTYDKLIELCKGGDPLIDVDRPDSWKVTPEGLLILGQSGPTDYASDMLIRIEPGGLRAWMRDPEGTTAEDAFHGAEWTAEAFFQEYDSLCTLAYSW